MRPGPVITLYEVEPGAGVKVNRILSLADDLQLALSALSVRIIAPIPGRSAVGIEISNKRREKVYLKEIIANKEFQSTEYTLPLAFGKDIHGDLFMADLQKMPHLLIAGTTGAGKSVFINALICSLLYRFTPDKVKMLMIDPKMLELTQYEGIPHLIMPVVTDTNRAALALKWAVREMERRYDLMSKVGARNVEVFNKKVADGIAQKLLDRLPSEDLQALNIEDQVEPLPYIIIVIDELSDLMMIAAKDVELSIARLAQMARAGGIHLILSTQRPSVDVLTGLIKANFSARVSFQVSSKIDSRTILDTQGAERLLGDGDMLFLPPGTSKLLRIHAPFVSDGEVAEITKCLRAQGKPMLDEFALDQEEERNEESDDFEDALYDQAIAVVRHSGQASISMLQRRLRVGYNRAARMIERMEMDGIVGPSDGVRPRDVLIRNLD